MEGEEKPLLGCYKVNPMNPAFTTRRQYHELSQDAGSGLKKTGPMYGQARGEGDRM